MNILIPFVFWCATALYLVCAYPISPPGQVSGLSSSIVAHVLFLITTLVLMYVTFVQGRSRRGTGKKERFYRRAAYSWLCVVILFVFFAVNDLVRRGTTYLTVPMMLLYGLGLAFLAGIFFVLLGRSRTNEIA